jgi:hypothetical protein
MNRPDQINVRTGQSVTVDETSNEISFFSDICDLLMPGYGIPKSFQTAFIFWKILYPKENYSAGEKISTGIAENLRETDS